MAAGAAGQLGQLGQLGQPEQLNWGSRVSSGQPGQLEWGGLGRVLLGIELSRSCLEIIIKKRCAYLKIFL